MFITTTTTTTKNNKYMTRSTANVNAVREEISVMGIKVREGGLIYLN